MGAREDMLQNVRGYKMVKKGLSRRLLDIEHEKRRAKSEVPFISTSGVSASYLSGGHEHWAPMDPIYYHEKSCSFRNTYTRCPIFRSRVTIGNTEPRAEEFMGLVDIRKRMSKKNKLKGSCLNYNNESCNIYCQIVSIKCCFP